MKCVFATLLTMVLVISGCASVGTIKGNVVDSAKTMLLGVQIQTNPPTQSVLSDDEGIYTIREVPQGAYLVTAEKEGYKKSKVEVTVKGDKTTTADIVMSEEGNTAK